MPQWLKRGTSLNMTIIRHIRNLYHERFTFYNCYFLKVHIFIWENLMGVEILLKLDWSVCASSCHFKLLIYKNASGKALQVYEEPIFLTLPEQYITFSCSTPGQNACRQDQHVTRRSQGEIKLSSCSLMCDIIWFLNFQYHTLSATLLNI